MEVTEEQNLDKVNSISSKKSRHRKKQKYNEIRKQMEFYFGDSNLSKDRFLKQLIDEDPYVPLETFLTFNRMKILTESVKELSTALENSSLLRLSEDKTKVCRVSEVKQKDDVDDYIIYVESLPPNADHDWIRNTFSIFGPIAYVSLPRYKSTKKIKEFAFIEFEQKSSVEKALIAFEEFRGIITSENNPEDLLSIVTYLKEESEIHKTRKVTPPAEDISYEEPPTKRVKLTKDETVKEEIVVMENSTVDPVENKESERTDEMISVEHSETSDNNETSEVEQKVDGGDGKKKRKRMRRKTVGMKPSTDSGITDLRITTKTTWKRLRNKYLNLQREKLKQIKQKFRNERLAKVSPHKPIPKKLKPTRNINFYGALESNKVQEDNHSNKQNTLNPMAQDVSNKKPLFQYEPGIIISIKLSEPCVDIKDFKAEMRQYSEVKYIDIVEGGCEAFIRLDTSKSVEQFIKKCAAPEYVLKVLSGNQEKQYWGKIKKDREDKLTKKIKVKPKETSVEKIVRKSTHIRFEED